MVARQVRRSVVIRNLRVGLLTMDSDRLPLRKRKDVLHGAVRAVPLKQSVEQPCRNPSSRGFHLRGRELHAESAGEFAALHALGPQRPSGSRRTQERLEKGLMGWTPPDGLSVPEWWC